MRPTISFRRGDVVLVGFMFSDESGWKHRPAVVLSFSTYHASRQEVIVAAITSNVRRLLFGDHRLASWKEAGLLFPSGVTGILRTIKGTMVHRKLGSLARADMRAVDKQVRRMLELERGS